MAAPSVPIKLTYDTTFSCDQAGGCREFWMRFPGLRAASDADSPGGLLYYLENPIGEDLVILTALAVITTVDAQDGDIDVGLCDDADGTSIGAEIFDSIVNTAAGVFEGTIPQAVAGTGAKPIWKVSGTSTDSYLGIYQRGDDDVSSLRWNLLLKVIPYNDMINSNVELGALTVA